MSELGDGAIVVNPEISSSANLQRPDVSIHSIQDQKDVEIAPKENPFGKLDNFASYIIKHRKPIDYAEIVKPETRVLALGETHTQPSSKGELQYNLKQLKELGFTHIGLEMIKTDMQDMLDEYLATGARRDELLSQLRSDFEWYKGAGSQYMAIINEAKALGMGVVGLDMPRTMQKETQQDDRVDKRDIWMKQSVEKVLNADEDNKIVTFTGVIHAENSEATTMAGLLASKGIPVTNVRISGGKDVGKSWLLERAAKQAGVSGEKFMLPCRANIKDVNSAPPL